MAARASFPPACTGGPRGGGRRSILFNHHGDAVDPVFPLPEAAHYAEIALRGMSTMVPALAAYIGKAPRPYIDGGYYIKTRENRPLIGPLPVEGAYISGAFSGFGVMASCAGGELLARHITRGALPDYAPAFLLSRYQDAAYSALLDDGATADSCDGARSAPGPIRRDRRMAWIGRSDVYHASYGGSTSTWIDA